jgi:hypothetical protein
MRRPMLNGGLLLFMSSIGDAVAQTAHASVWSAAVAIVMVAPSVGHIEASMVPMPVSVADPNSDVADPDIGAFRDDHRLIADVRRTGKCRHRQKRNNEKRKQGILCDTLFGLGTFHVRMSAKMHACYA